MSTVAKKIMMGSGAAGDSAYEIEQSLIFNGDAGLYRYPTSDGNRRTWTLSIWVKRNLLGGWQNIIGGAQNTPADYVYINPDNQVAINGYQNGVPTNFYTETTRVLRDVGAWYHIVINFDTTQSTASNRMKIWVNGVQETSFDVLISPSQNFQTQFNKNAIPMYVGKDYTTGSYMKGQLAEMHWLDGVTKPASNFGETNEDTGQWIPKEYEGGSYGTNGAYLKFVSGAIGTDSSGQGNTYTVQSLVNADVVIDSPTNNFCTLNSLMTYSATTLSEGNLKSAQSNHSDTMATFKIPETGKWYFECVATTAGGAQLGISKVTYQPSAGSWVSTTISLIFSNGQAGTGSGSAYIGSAISNGNTVGVAIDSDNGKIYFAKNNTWGNSGNPLTGSNPAAAFTATDGWQPIVYGPSGAVQTFNFGQKDFAYTPPSGFLTLSTKNLPDPAIPLPEEQFNAIAYTGDGGLDVTGVGFRPDLVWAKSLSGYNHQLHDAVRGATAGALFSNSNTAQTSYQFDSFDSDGFTTDSGNITGINGSNDPMVAWNWKANGAGSTDTSGDIDGVVSANQAAGFSIITWTGDGGGHTTVPHGLGVAPEIIFEKYRNAAGNWYTWLTVIDGTNDFLRLDLNSAAGDAGASGTPTSQFFSNWGSPSGRTNVAYAFVSKPGYSKIGTYTGNGNAVGPFVNLGFKPAFVMVKRTDATAYWTMFDNARSPFNEVNKEVYANEPQAETTSYKVDFLSNGFKFRNTGNDVSTNNGVYLYMAFAESPFKYANAH